MQSQVKERKKLAFLKGASWFIFSGTAMLSAFILPMHFIALASGYRLRTDVPLVKLYAAVLLIAGLYHGLYRTATVVFDLGFVKHHGLIEKILVGILIVTSIGIVAISL